MRAVAQGPRERPVHFTAAQLDLSDRFAALLPDAQGPQPLRQQNRTHIGTGHAHLAPGSDAR